MKLGRSAVASAKEIAEETVSEMINKNDLSKEVGDKISETFNLVLELCDTESIMLLATECILALDKECYDELIGSLSPTLETPIYNSINYETLNKIDEGLKS